MEKIGYGYENYDKVTITWMATLILVTVVICRGGCRDYDRALKTRQNYDDPKGLTTWWDDNLVNQQNFLLQMTSQPTFGIRFAIVQPAIHLVELVVRTQAAEPGLPAHPKASFLGPALSVQVVGVLFIWLS